MKKQAKILVVDDDTAILDAISTALEVPNYYLEIFTSTSAEDALKVIEKELPNLILLDLNLPGMDGFGLVETIRKVPKWRRIKMIMLTAEDTKEKLWESIDRDLDDFIAKPFDLLELEARVFQQLHRLNHEYI